MKNEKTSGKYELDRARELIAQGWSNAQIWGVPICKDIPIGTLGAMRSRLKATKKEGKVQRATDLQHGEATQESATKPLENAATTPVFVLFVKNVAQTFHPADLVFYGCVAIGCFGIADALPGIGVAVAAVWSSIAALLLHRLKMYARWGDVAVGVVIEVLCGGVAHFVWANDALWSNIERLPFEVYVEKYRNGAGELVAFYAGRDVEKPGNVAIYVAVVLCLFAAYAAFVSISANRKKR